MSEQSLISPLLDNYIVGDPFSARDGVQCCPAMNKETEEKYIVKIISTPANPTQMEAMLLSGAFADSDAALGYYEELTKDIEAEVAFLEKLSQLEGFVPYTGVQTSSGDSGFSTYLLSPYRRTLARKLRKEQLTHLAALNLALDICSALSVCRRSGYLYVSLKPENIIVTDEGTYKIGDIGFIKMQSLQYASLPDRYRSAYTAPEIADAFSSLNATVDIYALGLILYQIFNGGSLPNHINSGETLPPPEYADYEMSEILLKACSADPNERWQDPVEMGQAIVSYMQRNGAHDTPIIPQPEIIPEPESEEVASEADVQVEYQESMETGELNDIQIAEGLTHDDEEEDAPVYTEDASGNLTFLSDDDILPEDELAQMEHVEVSDEVSEILDQADDLIAHPTPDPVVAPEPIDVPVPEPIQPDTPQEISDSNEEQQQCSAENIEPSEEHEDPAEITDVTEEAELIGGDITEEDNNEVTPRKRHWLRNTLLVLLSLALLAAGYFFYKEYYLQDVDSLRLEGRQSSLNVYVESELPDEKLHVICSDIYGNQLSEPVKNGKAVFNNLAPNCAYSVKIIASGFHQLIGHTTDSYTTPTRAEIVQFTAVAGSEDGSVILGFTVEGQDPQAWKITYSTPGEPTKSTEFTGHMVTLTGLTVGQTYKFKLSPVEPIYTTGTDELEYTACTIVRAADLMVTGCTNGILSVTWLCPENITVSSWTVHCYNDDGYDKTIVTEDTSAQFDGVSEADDYTVEVTAAGMSVSQRVYVESYSVTVKDFTVSEADLNQLLVTWEQATQPAVAGWNLQYSVDGSAVKEISCDGNSAVIYPRVPGSTYAFSLKTADDRTALGGSVKFATKDAADFDQYGVQRENLDFMMCKTPPYANWNRYYLDDSDYTTSFEVGEEASFLVRIRTEYDTSWEEVITLYVIRDAAGNIVSTSTTSSSWTYMWYRNYGEFDIPSIPSTPGEYSISIYFNGALAGTTLFSVYE